MVVASRRLRPASLHHVDPTAVGVGDVVETKKLPRTPTNQRASDLIDHGLDLDVACRERRSNKKEESVAAFLGLEVSGGPRKEFDQWGGPWLMVVHETPSAVKITVQVTTRPKSGGRTGAWDTLPDARLAGEIFQSARHFVVAGVGVDGCRQGRHISSSLGWV